MRVAAYMISLVLPVCALSADRFLLVPNHLDNPDGGNSTSWPFTISDFDITSRRYQQVYDASQFATIGQEGAYIKELLFRAESFPGVASDFLDNVQVNLGITARSPDSLSAVFSENVGFVDTVVFGPSPLQISTATGWTVIPLTQPFFYLPGAGNLLLDIRTIDNSPFPFARRTLDAEDTVGDSISAVMANDINANSGFLTTRGLVTGFLVEPIPEPSTLALLGLGVLAMWRFCFRRTNK